MTSSNGKANLPERDLEEKETQRMRSNSLSGVSDQNQHANLNVNVQNSFSADSPYFSSYVENEMNSMNIFHQTLKDVAARTKTFGKCGALMSESTRRLALACRLQQPRSEEDGENEDDERHREAEVLERRRAIGEDMASLLGVMSEVCIIIYAEKQRMFKGKETLAILHSTQSFVALLILDIFLIFTLCLL